MAPPAAITTTDGVSGVEEAFTRASEPLKKKPQKDDEEELDGSLSLEHPLIPRELSQLNGVSRHLLTSRSNGLAAETTRRIAQADRFERLQSGVLPTPGEKGSAAVRSLELVATQPSLSVLESGVQKTTQPSLSASESAAQKTTQQMQGKEILPLAIMRSDEAAERVASSKVRSLADVGAMQPLVSPLGGVRAESVRSPVATESAFPQRMAQYSAAPELQQSSPSSSANSDLVYRFQRWGGDHAVMIQPQMGGGLQLNSSDALVHQRLDEHWSAGNPQQWQLSRDGDEGKQHNTSAQDEDEEA
ncbi:MAG: type III secretion system needle length determinant, SpaN/EivJ family [Plesiomonas sp.]|uniref:SpaN/EivJ family type III secretion system needle length determinant n=1 Tax=Plesiomonas sp. TaxID=2486279 RepID=UPI003F3D7A3E